jgi:hypothetical protein
MRRTRLLLALLLIAAGSVSGLGIDPGAANAAGVQDFDCPSGYGCLWTGLNGGGERWRIPQCGATRVPGNMDNDVESAQNRGGGTIHFYDALDSGSYMTSVVNNGQPVNLHLEHRNRTSSIRVDC